MTTTAADRLISPMTAFGIYVVQTFRAGILSPGEEVVHVTFATYGDDDAGEVELRDVRMSTLSRSQAFDHYRRLRAAGWVAA